MSMGVVWVCAESLPVDVCVMDEEPAEVARVVRAWVREGDIVVVTSPDGRVTVINWGAIPGLEITTQRPKRDPQKRRVDLGLDGGDGWPDD